MQQILQIVLVDFVDFGTNRSGYLFLGLSKSKTDFRLSASRKGFCLSDAPYAIVALLLARGHCISLAARRLCPALQQISRRNCLLGVISDRSFPGSETELEQVTHAISTGRLDSMVLGDAASINW